MKGPKVHGNDLLAVGTAELPDHALLARYRQDGAYTDCYVVDIPGHRSHPECVDAFYTTRLFKVERFILAVLARRPSTDAQAQALAVGHIDRFAAWTVEDRTENQLLLRDFLGRTRSWLMSTTHDSGDGRMTRLYFGSAVVPVGRDRGGRAKFGVAFHALHGFHHVYSRALLRAAGVRLRGCEPGR